jgi:hypothetical protein
MSEDDNLSRTHFTLYDFNSVLPVLDWSNPQYVSGSNHKRQTYAYDTYGNIKTITTIVDGLVTNTQTLAPSPSTNRLTNAGTTYDESGNLTAWPTWSYTYDGLDMMLTHNNGRPATPGLAFKAAGSTESVTPRRHTGIFGS